MKALYLKILFFLIILVLLITKATPVWGLFFGILFSFILGSPYQNEKLSSFHRPLLQIAIVGLGFGMNINDVLSVGLEGLWVTLITIIFIVVLGIGLGKFLKLESKIALLISSGTAICGGSAIAAISPIIGAKSNEMSTSLSVVFILNAVALLVFPLLGTYLNMTEVQFAWWSAIAIHDTSSVVGAAAQFGDTSLALATTIKLTRALWIIPFALIIAFTLPGKEKKIVPPYFIFLFVVAALLSTYVAVLEPILPFIKIVSKSIFTGVLFLIGMSVSKAALKETGVTALVHGIVLWLVIIIVSLLCVYYLL